MSTCSNCYNGCTEIVSDRCVKYTGIDVPVLGIQTGDSLSFVEQALITFLVSTLDGTGVKIDLAPVVVCNLVQKYLPTCGDLSIVDISKALIQAACDLQAQVDAIVADIVIINDKIDVIEADYTVKCLIDQTPSITPSSGTHAILQATIDTLCALVLDLDTNYVRYDELDELIQVYLNTSASGAISNKMVPYAVVPYFGPITFFDSSGAGTGDWNRIFLCNGNNGTPDLRGRALTGVINGVPGPTMSPVVDPAVSSANPNYSLFDNVGANQVTLLSTQIPAHTHSATAISTDSGHTHSSTAGQLNGENDASINYAAFCNSGSSSRSQNVTLATSTGTANITTTVTVNPNTGGGLPHANIQPVTACYYIQYRP
jgi:microcystin-dependent protein